MKLKGIFQPERALHHPNGYLIKSGSNMNCGYSLRAVSSLGHVMLLSL